LFRVLKPEFRIAEDRGGLRLVRGPRGHDLPMLGNVAEETAAQRGIARQHRLGQHVGVGHGEHVGGARVAGTLKHPVARQAQQM